MEFGSPLWWIYVGISVFLVLFGGTMSGLTLGLMSLDLVELEVLQRSGTSMEKKQAATIFPVVQKQHQLLVTLLLCNAIAMEALPIFLDDVFNPVIAVLLSVTFVLAFGEIIPQALCSRYGLAIGANLVWLVQILMILCFPIAYPVGKLLDSLLGHKDAGLFRRAQLKALVSIHGKEEGRGGELTHDETTIISGALDLTSKIAEAAMTPIESTFSLDVDTKLDWETLGRILATGHSRVPVYSGNPRNIIGLLLVKSLLTVRAEAETPLSAVSIRRMPRVPADLPLYDILNEFQKGQSHMAAVVRRPVKKSSEANFQGSEDKEVVYTKAGSGLERRLLSYPDIENGQVELYDSDMDKGKPESYDSNVERGQPVTHASQADDTKLQNQGGAFDDLEEGEVIGIITLEDVIEELLQEEIVDETDEYVDVHKRIRVAATAAASGAPSRSGIAIRRLSSPKVVRVLPPSSPHHKYQTNYENKAEKTYSLKTSNNLTQPLLEGKHVDAST